MKEKLFIPLRGSTIQSPYLSLHHSHSAGNDGCSPTLRTVLTPKLSSPRREIIKTALTFIVQAHQAEEFCQLTVGNLMPHFSNYTRPLPQKASKVDRDSGVVFGGVFEGSEARAFPCWG